jgi:hypothetical protein
MLSARWRIHFGPPSAPPFIVMGTAALISLAAVQFASAAPLRATALAPDCTAPDMAPRAAGRHSAAPAAVADRLDQRGDFLGRVISGTAAGRPFAITLPVESSVSAAIGDALVYTRALGGKSEVHLVDLANGCDALLAKPAGTVRSAVLDPSASALYVHSVTYPTRADAGVSRYPLDGGSPRLVVPALADDADFGLTFGTQLGWSTNGATLFVHSCGAQECRTRLLGVASGSVSSIDRRGHGQIVALTPEHLVTYGACPGLPCSISSTNLATGSEVTLAAEAWAASLDGTTLNIETAQGKVQVAQ